MASGNNGDIADLSGDVENKLNLNQDSGASVALKGIDQAAGGDNNAFGTTTNSKKDESSEPRNIPADQRSGDYQKLIQSGLDEKVAAKLDDIYCTGKADTKTVFLYLNNIGLKNLKLNFSIAPPYPFVFCIIYNSTS